MNKENILTIAGMYINDIYAESYPLLVQNKDFILSELKKEIERFESTLENGMKEFRKIFEQNQAENRKEISGKDAFYLYDTFGFPIELTVELAAEEGLSVDEAGFAASMEEQKQKARENQNFSAKLSTKDAAVYDKLGEDITTEFDGYTSLTAEERILALVCENEICTKLSENEEGILIVGRTPFYATMGGQQGDKGIVKTKNGTFVVEDTVKLPGNRIGHAGKVIEGTISVSDIAVLSVDEENRRNTCRNHSATHLMQKALQEVLGDHVEQQGSYQDAGRTRFDFSHSGAMTADELKKVEKMVNEKIAQKLQVVTDVMSLEDAKKSGAMALFGEKYGESVRVVSMGDFSKELCGGTHVENTADILSFKILSENGVAAGVRRIEAITGSNVLEYYENLEKTLEQAAKTVKATPQSLNDRLEHMMAELKALQSENEALKAKAAKEALGDVMDNVQEIQGVKLLATSVDGVDMNGLRDLGDSLKEKLGEGVVILLSNLDGKVNMIAMATEDAIRKGAHAGNLIKGIAACVGGGGGGRPNMAQAGGKNPAGIPDAIEAAARVLAEQLSK